MNINYNLKVTQREIVYWHAYFIQNYVGYFIVIQKHEINTYGFCFMKSWNLQEYLGT